MGKGRQRCAEFATCTWSHNWESALQMATTKKIELLLDIDKLLIALYTALGYLDGCTPLS